MGVFIPDAFMGWIMPASSREEALATVAEYSEAAQHTHLGEVEWKTDHHGHKVKGYAFTDDTGATYQVYDPSDKTYMTVAYQFNLIRCISERLDSKNVERYLNTPVAYQTHEDEPESIVAARAYLDTIDSEVMATVQEEVKDVLSNRGVTYRIQTTKNDSLHRFFVYQKIFPYHEGFTPDTYISAVQAVRVPGIEATSTLTEHIDLTDIGVNAEEELAEQDADTSEDKYVDPMYK